MLPEELDVSLLAGLAVIEVGCRQAWPFLALIDQRGEREVRLYFDTDMRVEGEGGGGFSQEDAGLLAALGRSSTVRSSVHTSLRVVIYAWTSRMAMSSRHQVRETQRPPSPPGGSASSRIPRQYQRIG